MGACSRRSTLKSGTNPVAPTFSTIVVDKILDDIEKPIRFSSQQLRMATSNFSHLLGAGSFGAVYKGTFTNGLLVAVKALNGSSDKKIEDQFLAEVTTIGRTHHMNLVSNI
ncbi:hypothetical protein NL676_034726 [Syzygium grande]|nr:hypothetical protein NL676_034726 [Syzygium grande]